MGGGRLGKQFLARCSMSLIIRAVCSLIGVASVSTLDSVPAGARSAPSEIAFSVHSLPGAKDQATGVACTPDGPCIALDFSGQLYALSGPHVEPIGAVGFDTYGISCPTRTFCVVVGDDTVLILSATGSRIYTLQYEPEWKTHWQSVSCSSPTFCMIGGGVHAGSSGSAGVVASWNGLSWSPVQVVLPAVKANPTVIWSLSCSSPTLCIAADSNRRVVQWNGRKWTSPGRFGEGSFDSFSASCTSDSFCLALGATSTRTLTWNGRSWRERASGEVYSNDGSGFVSCLSSSDCVAAMDNGAAEKWNGHGWGNATPPSSSEQDGIQGLACSSAGFCEAVTSGDHFVYMYDPHKPPHLPILCGLGSCQKTTI